MRLDRITPEVVELAPRELDPGKLYISPKYRSAIHLCCCGCGEKVVTPLSAAEWRLTLSDDRATLHPSIGNWSMACRSHYWIRGNKVIWGPRLSDRQIKTVFERDQQDLKALHRIVNSRQAASTSSQPSPELPSEKVTSGGWVSWLRGLWAWLTR